MTERIFFDLDGTLVDSTHRLYDLFAELIPENYLTYEEYWRIKRIRINQHDLLCRYFNYSEAQIEQFRKDWMNNIEDPARLDTDTPLHGVSELLQRLSHKKELYLVTARQYPDRVNEQLHQFGWSGFFTGILDTQQQQSKASLIRSTLHPNITDILVGDSGEDMMCGKELGMKTIAVSSGILNPEVLLEYQPDAILDTVVAAESLLLHEK